LRHYSISETSSPLLLILAAAGDVVLHSSESLKEQTELSHLKDIRDNQSYRTFVSYIGGVMPQSFAQTNGYDILAKDYKRELKYAAGNLMQIQLRQFVDKSV
jgi:hypothetical protein